MRANNIIEGEFSYDDLVYVPPELVSNRQLIKEGDIVITMSSGSKAHVGKVALARKDLEYSYGAFCAKIQSTGIMPAYLYYSLQDFRFRKYIESQSKGTNINNIKQSYIQNYEIPVPPLDEQARIVSRIEELFSELDNGVETLTKTKQQLIKYRRAVIKDELNHNYGISGKIYTTIGETCNCLDSRRRPVKKSNRNTSDAIYPYYGANGVTGKINDYIFDEDLVLVVEDETFIGRIKPFSYTVSGKCWINNHAHVLTGKEGIMDNKYLNYQLSYYPFLPMVTGTTGRKKLTQKSLLAAPITICEYEHQKTVVAQIEKN